MFRPLEKRTSPRMAPRARKKSELFTNGPDSKLSPNVIQLPTVVVAVEADADAHGWHVRARRAGGIYYRYAFGLLSTANREAVELSSRREFWWLA